MDKIVGAVVGVAITALIPATNVIVDSRPVAPVKELKPLKTVNKGVERLSKKKVPVRYVISGDWVSQCQEWAAQAGIAWTSSVERLIHHESKCNPRVWNGAGSGACGIPQALPCSKLPNGIETDPVSQLRWMDNYVHQRYGGWDEAWSFWQFGAPKINGNNWY